MCIDTSIRFLKHQRIKTNDKLRAELQKYIHGIEIDEDVVEKCKQNLDAIALSFGVKKILIGDIKQARCTQNRWFQQ